ncbi:MAG TPA: hypothetical protein VN538_12820 [Clostridia bacterium]|nr:hypothetical protein [Clostridia bacterium]
MMLYDKLFDEIYAVLAINKAYPISLDNLVKGEHPDWQDRHVNFGIEVVRAMTQHMGYVRSIWNRYHGQDIKAIPLNKRKGFKGDFFTHKGKLVGISDNKGMVDGTNHITLAIEATCKKLELLNSSHFNVFHRNELFVFVPFTIDDSDLDLFCEKYQKVAGKFIYRFINIYLFDNNSLTRVSEKDLSLERYMYLEEQASSIKQVSSLLREKHQWPEKQRFIDNYEKIALEQPILR